MANKYITALLIALFVGGGLYYYERPSSVGNNTLIYLGDSVYIEDERVFINVTPHACVGGCDPIIELELKNLSTVPPLTMLLGYNNEIVTPSNPRVYNPKNVTREENYTCQGTFNYTLSPKYFWCYVNDTLVFEHSFDRGSIPTKTAYWNVTETVDWQPLNKPSGMIKHDFNGKNTWRYISNIEGLQSDVRYRMRVHLDVPYLPLGKTAQEVYPGYDPKYDVAFMPSSYGANIAAAIADNNFYLIDPTVDLTNGLIAYYKLNESGTTAIDSTNNFNGTHTNNMQSPSGIINNSRLYVPNNYTSIADADNFTPATLTVSGWMNLSSGTVRNGFISKWYGGGGAAATSYYFYVISTSEIRFYITNAASSIKFATCTGTFPTGGQYQHFVGTYNGTHIQIYLNGTACGSPVAQTGAIRNSAAELRIGNDIDNGYFNGAIDEVGLWSRPLNSTEIAYLYNNGTGCSYPFDCEAAPPGGVYWLQNITNITANHNGTPYIYSVKFNLTNSSPGCLVTNITSNDTTHPIDNATGWFNLTGGNISATGVSWVKITGSDNCSNNVTQTFWVNITNTAPINNWTNNTVNNSAASPFTTSNYCRDSDRDTMYYSVNNTLFSMLSNGSMTYDGLGAEGTYSVLIGCSDLNINTTAVTYVLLTGANVGNASTVSLCSGVTSLSIPINPNHRNLSDNKYYGTTLARGTTLCTLNLSTANETLPIRFNASTNVSSVNSSILLTVNGINYTLNSTSRNLFNLTPNTTTLINVSGVYYNYTGLSPFSAKLMIRLWG